MDTLDNAVRKAFVSDKAAIRGHAQWRDSRMGDKWSTVEVLMRPLQPGRQINVTHL